MNSNLFWFYVQSASGAAGCLIACICALLVARRFSHSGFLVIGAGLFLQAVSSLTVIFIASSESRWRDSLTGLVTAIHFITLIVMLVGWIWVAFVSAGNGMELIKKWTSPGPGGEGGALRIAVRVGAIFCAMASLAAGLWALLVCFASGMKSAPSMNLEDALIGGIPSLVLLLAACGLCYGVIVLRAGLGYLIASIVGAIFCLLGLALVGLTYFGQP